MEGVTEHKGEFVCGCIFQGRKIDFLPTTVPLRVETVSTASTFPKRKMDVDEDIDLYGEEEPIEKNPHSSDKADRSKSENGVTAATQNQMETPTTDELEWLMFLVSQEGALQVYNNPTLLTIDSTTRYH